MLIFSAAANLSSMYYHAAVLLLFRPFLKAKFTESDISPSEVCRQSANQISDIFAQHRRLYGTTGIYTFQLHCLLTACTIHIINLPALSSTTYLTAACNHFHDLIPHNDWAASALSVIKGLIQKWTIILPQETESALYRPSPPSTTSTPPFPDESSPDIFRSPTTTTTSSKRSAFLQPENLLQKRQRLLAPRGEFGTRELRDQPVNYLFAPFPNQPAPLLGPIHTSTTAGVGAEGRRWNEEINRVAGVFDGLRFEGDGGWFDQFVGWQGE